MSATNGHVLGDVAAFVRGITFTPEDLKPPLEKGTVVCMRTKNVQVNLDEQDLIAVPKEFVRRKEQYLSEGDLLVSSANSWNLVGKCCWVPKLDYEATAGGFISILRADRKKVDPRYLYHWFAASQTQHEVRLCGRQTTNISNLNYERCLNLPIPLPKLEEQKRIAAILDKADAIRRKRQETIHASAKLVDSTFYQLFGDPLSPDQRWNVKVVGDVAGIIVPTRDKPKSFTGTIPWVTLPDVHGLFIGESNLRLTKQEAADVGTRLTPSGAVLLSCAGSLNVVAITECELYTNQQFYALIPKPDAVNPIYLAYSLKLRGEEFYKRLSGTVTISFFSKSKALGISLACPPLALQKRFTDRFLAIQALQAKMESQALEASDLFNSLVQRAFKGEL